MKTTLSQKPTWRRRLLVGVGLFSLALFLVLFVRMPLSRNSVEREPHYSPAATTSQPDLQNSALAPPSTSSAPALSGSLAASNKISELMDEGVMLSSLKNWIKRTDGVDVEIVRSQKVYDMTGQPVSLTVIASALPGGLSQTELHDRLASHEAEEAIVRARLRDAYRANDTNTVNRLAAEFANLRSVFIQTNRLSSYKLSLSPTEPPVLAHWGGLTFEEVRGNRARDALVRKYGQTVQFHSLVQYTTLAALLCFTNDVGSTYYIDPVTLREFNITSHSPVVPPHPVIPDRDGRSSRLANQWAHFLSP